MSPRVPPQPVRDSQGRESHIGWLWRPGYVPGALPAVLYGNAGRALGEGRWVPGLIIAGIGVLIALAGWALSERSS